MNTRIRVLLALSILLVAIPTAALAGAENTPESAEQMKALGNMCTETAGARAERQATEPLYDRLGGYERIESLVAVIVHNHAINPDFKEMMTTIDQPRLIKHVTDFVAAGTGGSAKYTGRSLKDSHTPLDFNDADFLSAGADVVKSMQHMGYDQNEIDEFVCILVSLKDQVVFK